MVVVRSFLVPISSTSNGDSLHGGLSNSGSLNDPEAAWSPSPTKMETTRHQRIRACQAPPPLNPRTTRRRTSPPPPPPHSQQQCDRRRRDAGLSFSSFHLFDDGHLVLWERAREREVVRLNHGRTSRVVREETVETHHQSDSMVVASSIHVAAAEVMARRCRRDHHPHHPHHPAAAVVFVVL